MTTFAPPLVLGRKQSILVNSSYPKPVVASQYERFRAGDESVLKEIFEEHSPLITGLSRKLVGDYAEDLVQTVFLTAWRSRSTFDPNKGSMSSWLCGITKFRAIDHWRKVGRNKSVAVEDVERVQSDAGDSTEDTESLVERVVVSEALKALPPVKRQVIELGFIEGLSHNMIADKLGLPLGTVKSHIRRGLEVLQNELGGSRGE